MCYSEAPLLKACLEGQSQGQEIHTLASLQHQPPAA